MSRESPQPTAATPRENQTPAPPEKPPEPTLWPAALALGVTLLAWGLITSLILVGVGLALLAISLAGWIGEIRHEHRSS